MISSRTLFVAACAASLAACGDGARRNEGMTAMGTSSVVAPPSTADTTAPGTGAAVAPPGGGAAQAATGKTWEVKMVQEGATYRFDPATLTIKVGDAVKWTVVSGPPHNVSFWPDSIPAGASTQLQANMPNTMAPLTSPLETNIGATYTISFAGVPAGTYRYYCTPHLALGMKAVLTVQ